MARRWDKTTTHVQQNRPPSLSSGPPPPGQWRQKRNLQRSFLLASGLQPSHQLLDIGCGTLRGGIPLIDYLEKGNYVGLEPRKKALDEALRFVQEHLADKGVFYANVKIGDRDEREWLDYPVVWRTHEAYETACRQHGLSIEDLGPIKELGHETGDPAYDEQRMFKTQRNG